MCVRFVCTCVCSSDVCDICVYMCVLERVMVVCPLLCKRISKLPFPHRSYVRVTCVACACVAICACCEMCACATAHLPPTAVYTVIHIYIRTHILIMPSAPLRQMLLLTLQSTRYEHPIGEIRRLKAKVTGNIVHHVTVGRALSVADLKWQCAGPRGSPPLRLFMGQRFSVMKHPTRRDDRTVPTSEASHWSSVIKHPTRRDDRKVPTGEASQWFIVIKHATRRDDRQVPTSAASHRLMLIKHFSHYTNKTLTTIFLIFITLINISKRFVLRVHPILIYSRYYTGVPL